MRAAAEEERHVGVPRGNLAPEGSVIKATALDPTLIEQGHYRHEGSARVFTSAASAIAVPVLTDARFSGVSTGACVGHIGPEALAGGPLGKLEDGDLVAVYIDPAGLTGSIDFVGTQAVRLTPEEAERVLAARPPHPELRRHPELPGDTRLWAALRQASGGTWAGCVNDVDRIVRALEAGLALTCDELKTTS